MKLASDNTQFDLRLLTKLENGTFRGPMSPIHAFDEINKIVELQLLGVYRITFKNAGIINNNLYQSWDGAAEVNGNGSKARTYHDLLIGCYGHDVTVFIVDGGHEVYPIAMNMGKEDDDLLFKGHTDQFIEILSNDQVKVMMNDCNEQFLVYLQNLKSQQKPINNEKKSITENHSDN